MHVHRRPRFSVGSVRNRLVAVGMLLLVADARAGSPPLLDFDVPFSIGCRTLPIKNPALEGGAKELVEAVIPISARLQAGVEKDLKHCLYTVVDPSEPATLTVTDLLPQTQLKTEYAKPIQFTNEKLAKIGINLSAHYVVAATGDASGQLKSGMNYELLPPQDIVLASGTLQHGHGVFYELKPSSQTTLEGIKSYSVIFAVPRGWRGGCLRLDCEAVGIDRGVLPQFDRDVQSGRAVFYLALHRAGDGEAERFADDVARSQQDLFDSLGRRRREVKAASHNFFSWPAHTGRLSTLFERSTPSSDHLLTPAELALFDHVLDRATTLAWPIAEFPAPVLDRLADLRVAARALQALSVGRPGVPAPPPAPASKSAAPPQQQPAAAPQPNPAKCPEPAAATAVVAAGPPKADATLRPPAADKTEPRKPSAPAPAAGKEVAVTAEKARLPESAPGRAAEIEHVLTGPDLKPAFGEDTRPPSRAEDPMRPTPQAPGNFGTPDSHGQPPQGFSNQAWYLLASVWGALFTYILAPLVVEFVRKRMKVAPKRRHRHRHARTSTSAPPPPDALPPAQDFGAAQILSRPAEARHADGTPLPGPLDEEVARGFRWSGPSGLPRRAG